MCYINPRFTYSLTYLLTCFQQHGHHHHIPDAAPLLTIRFTIYNLLYQQII